MSAFDTVIKILGAGEAHIGEMGGRSRKISAGFSRPANTTGYTAGDVVNNSTSAPEPLTFTGAARVAGGSGVITDLLIIDSGNQTTKPSLELWLFHTAPAMDNDNAAFTPSDEELLNLVAIIPVASTFVGDATAGAGGNAVYQAKGINQAFVCTGAVTALYGVLVVRNAYTPLSGETFTVLLGVLQD